MGEPFVLDRPGTAALTSLDVDN